ncbi:hypothetical protein NJB1728f31_38400 [Mycobacterium marinum]|nr:hypothetical protein NJB1728f31_38400 [Mycobacterium marinum]
MPGSVAPKPTLDGANRRPRRWSHGSRVGQIVPLDYPLGVMFPVSPVARYAATLIGRLR